MYLSSKLSVKLVFLPKYPVIWFSMKGRDGGMMGDLKLDKQAIIITSIKLAKSNCNTNNNWLFLVPFSSAYYKVI